MPVTNAGHSSRVRPRTSTTVEKARREANAGRSSDVRPRMSTTVEKAKRDANASRSSSSIRPQMSLTTKPVANSGHPSHIRPPKSTTVESAIPDSTSVINAQSSTATGKRKSVEESKSRKRRQKQKKKKWDKRFEESLMHRGASTSVAKPLTDFVIPKKTGVIYYHRFFIITLHFMNNTERVLVIMITIQKITVDSLHFCVSTWMGDGLWRGKPSCYVTSHPG